MEISSQYWAGLFDGEGCVQPSRYVSPVHNEKFIVAIKVIVTQKEPMVCYLLQKQFGGAIRSQRNGSKFEITRWECGKAEEVFKFLSAIKPYVIIKAVEVMVALELLEGIMKSRENYNFRKINGRSYLSGKMPINMDEIRRRQILEQKFFEDRQDPKPVKLELKSAEIPSN